MEKPSGVPTDIDRWFVQIKEQTIGPLPGAKILERLLKDELQVTHRVSRDRLEWKAICNTEFFEDLIAYRIRMYSGESHAVGQMHPGGDDGQFEISQVFGVHGATEGISEQLDHARQLEELTANIQRLNALRKEINLLKKSVVVEKENDQPNELHPDDENVFIPVAKPKKKTTLASLLKGTVENQVRMMWLAGVIALGLASTQGYSYYTGYKRDVADRKMLKQALEAQGSGDYATAIANFKQVQGMSGINQKMATPKELLDLADAHIKGDDVATAQKLLTQATSMRPEAPERARLHILQATIATKAGNLSLASIELEESLKQAETFATLHNLGVLRLKMRRYEEAEPNLLKALAVADQSKNVDTAPTLLAMFEVALALDRKGLAASKEPTLFKMQRLESIAQLLDTKVQTATSLKEEIRLAIAVSRFHLGQPDAFRSSAYELMDGVKSEASYKTTADLDYDLASWSQLYKYCTEIYNQPGSNDFIAAFYSSCLKRSHGAQQALPFAKYALGVHPNDVVYIGLVADLLIQLKQSEDARKLLFPGDKPVVGSKLADDAMKRLEPRLPANSDIAEPLTAATNPLSTADPATAPVGAAATVTNPAMPPAAAK